MKGARALPLLLACAVAVGVILYATHHRRTTPSPSTGTVAIDPTLFLEGETGLQADSLPAPRPVDTEDLIARISTRLEKRFGPDGLARRARAFGLLGLLPPGQDLKTQLLAMQTAGARAWFDEHSGDLLTLDDFDPSRSDDRTTFVRLRTLQLLHRHFPPPSRHPGDDAWLAREAVHAGIASGVEARFLAVTGGRSALPTREETERQAILLSLPLFLHNLAQLGTMQGRDFAEDRRGDGPRPWADLLADPPAHTLALFSPLSPGPPPVLPDTPPALFEETLGAYSTYLLLERLSDYLLAEPLVPSWRGDRYRLFSNASGDHLIWICTWSTPQAAAQAAQLIQNTLSPRPDHPSFGTEARHTMIIARDNNTLFLNCADPETPQGLLPTTHPPVTR